MDLLEEHASARNFLFGFKNGINYTPVLLARVMGQDFHLNCTDLFIYTDGLSEARGAGNEYGVDRVAHLVHQHAGRQAAELIAACLDDLQAFTTAAHGWTT